MAAAFTGFASDGAAIWYNPAGLPLLQPKLLQGRLSLFQLEKRDIKDAIVSDGPDGPGGADEVEDFQIKSKPTLPGFAVASFALGKPKEALNNRKPLQMAISVFQTYNTELGGDVRYDDELGRTNSIQFYQKDRITYYGAAIGYRPTRKFSFGITLLASDRTLQHVETAAAAFGGTQDPSGGSPCPTSPTLPFCVLNARQVNRNTVFQMDAWNLSVRIGLLQLVGQRWRLGLMFQPPGIRVGGKSELRFELSDVRPDTDPNDPGLSDSVFADRSFSSRSPIPWKLRLGTSYVISSKMVVAADLQLVGPLGEGSLAPDIPQLEGRANTSGILLADSNKRDFTWNISMGTEIQLNRFLFTRLGFLTDRSGAPQTSSASTNAIRPAHVDRYGFSASFGAHKKEKGLSVGVSALFGKGTGNGLDFRGKAFASDTNFTRVSVKDRVFIISLGGDVGQAAGAMKTQMEEKKSEEELQQEREEARQASQHEMEAETDPEVKAARARAIEARREADAADERAKEIEAAAEELARQKREKENLNSEDQGAIQDMTKGGIGTLK